MKKDSAWAPSKMAQARQLRVCLTGGTAGIGLRLLRQLSASGHEVYLLARTIARANDAVRTLPDPSRAQQLVHPVVCTDLADFAAVRTAAAEVRAAASHLDVLILNAGVLNQTLRHVDGEWLWDAEWCRRLVVGWGRAIMASARV
jgi:NAD(P)-dependent dehydrogenase (short-subunit alcohol dehydrogenase family)